MLDGIGWGQGDRLQAASSGRQSPLLAEGASREPATPQQVLHRMPGRAAGSNLACISAHACSPSASAASHARQGCRKQLCLHLSTKCKAGGLDDNTDPVLQTLCWCR